VWSETYDRTLDDIFGIQDEIAEKVGGALSESILGSASSGQIAGVTTTSPDAYDLYLMALKERKTFSYGGLRAAEDLLKGALTIDPDFLDAKTELAVVYQHQSDTGLLGRDDAYKEIMAITAQVLEVRPDDADARAIRLFAERTLLDERSSPEEMLDLIEQLEQIVAEEPGKYQPRNMLAGTLRDAQQPDRALEIQLEGLELDPFNPRILYEIGMIYAGEGEWDEAEDYLKKSLQIEPVQPNAYVSLAFSGFQTGDGVDIMQQLLKAIESDPKDHELPGMIASFLYDLRLIEEGDDFRDRVLAIAPTSEVAYQVELSRAINTDDAEAGLISARRAIEDNIDNRRQSYSNAVQFLLRDAIRRGTVAEESAYLEQHAPGLLDIEADSPPSKYRAAQYSAFDAWYTTLPSDELNRRLDFFQDFAASYGFEPADSPRIMFTVLALRGDTEGAIDLALENLVDDSVLRYPGWRRTLAQAQYKDIVADSRIQSVMRDWEAEEAAIRESVRAYLADLHAST